jgi:hypothetical protein
MERDVHFVHGIGKIDLNKKKNKFSILFSFCLGCLFESNDNEFLHTDGNLAIEWESSAYYLRYLSGREQVNNKIMIM